MPPSVHKVLTHGCDIMEYFDAPISWFSEELQESSNKVFRKARAHHSRMFQRAKTNEDIVHFMIISDPEVSRFRATKQQKKKNLPQRVLHFIKK